MHNSNVPAVSNGRPALSLRDSVARMAPEFGKALPGHISTERFVRTAQTAIALTRNIDKVKNPQSLLAACTKAAADGLILDGREAALVIDYKGEAQYRPMMRGLLKLAYQSGELKGLVVEVVRQGDTFRHRPTNLAEPISHEIDHDSERGEVRVVYAMAELKDGGIVHEVMSVAAVNRIRDRSDGWKAFIAEKIKSTPWSTDWEEMARKTVFKRLTKYLPSSNEQLHQATERPDDTVTIEAEAVDTTPTKPAGLKTRGGAAALLKAAHKVMRQSAEIDREPVQADLIPGDEPEFDLQTGEIIETRDENPSDDI
ncbi:recombinase RecT [Hyphomicrobium sp. ghe19]|uniref:recombinase RecT n=1 Tax=Hyphomicrobium sp. ghe19 TaxID=2682968 RepID=UPI001367592A|nr:hypothetical protein HYPP_01930 [Hyphomicrobium sp. ghe19]